MNNFLKAYFPDQKKEALKPKLRVKAALHLNEMPVNLPLDLRTKISNSIKNIQLNRYPEPFAGSLKASLAEWYGCTKDQITIAPGSSAFIRLLISFFGTNTKGKLIITRPSFSYYEQFCKLFNISYDVWDLDDEFNYIPSKLDNLPDYSVVFLTSPNNPTGNTISIETMKYLLNTHKNSLFVVDEAYGEFVEESMLSLLNKFDNIVLLRTFSKAFCAAGVRCGVLISNTDIIRSVESLQTPWQLSTFTIIAVGEIIDFSKKTSWFSNEIKKVVAERDRMFTEIVGMPQTKYKVFPSMANFILIKAKEQIGHEILLKTCLKNGVLVKDLSSEESLKNCIRVTIGGFEENLLFENSFKESLLN